MAAMINTRFFSFSSELSSTYIQVSSKTMGKDGNGVSYKNNLIIGKYEGIEFPVVFKQESGRKIADILDTGWPSLYLISDKLRDVFVDAKLTGWKLYEVLVYDKKGKAIEGYHGFSVTGRSGLHKYKKESIFEKRLVPHGPLCSYYKGEYFEEDQWDGSDFFSPKDLYYTIVTQRAADVLQAHKITNLRLEPLSEVEVDVSYVKLEWVLP